MTELKNRRHDINVGIAILALDILLIIIVVDAFFLIEMRIPTYIFPFILLTICATLFGACVGLPEPREPIMNIPLTSADYLAFTTVESDQHIPYGDDPSQFVDLFLPDQMVAIMPAPKLPVAVLIHGGCWRAQYGLEPMGQLARSLNQQGIAVVNIEYRRLGNGGGWPTTFEDVAAAADSIRDLADKYNLDLENVVSVGHSAGGHLALWLASRHQLKAESTLFSADPLPIKAVVSLAGIPDLAEAVKQEICGSAPSELMGGLPSAVGSHYMEGSPSAFLPLGIPHVHINGVDDQIVPVAYVRRFVDAAQAAGDQAELIAVEDAGHFEIVAAHLPEWAVVEKAILEVLKN